MPPLPSEVRAFQVAELRADVEGKERSIIGRLVPYGVVAQVSERFTEEFARGVFRKSITEAARNLPLMVAHQHQTLPIGSAREWDDREDGLVGRWLLAETRDAVEALELVEGEHLSGMSVGFQPIKSDWQFNDPPDFDHVVRREARMLEASLCAIPTYDDARVLLTRTGEGRVKGTPRLDSWRAWLGTVKA